MLANTFLKAFVFITQILSFAVRAKRTGKGKIMLLNYVV